MNNAVNVRVAAVLALDRIARSGVSLRTGVAQFSTKINDPRDRALFSALLHAGARWWLRYDAVFDRLLKQPLRQREPLLHALLILALVQLEVIGIAAHAAVDVSVEATRGLGKAPFAGLVNAVLRRWLRERESLIVGLDTDVVTRHAHPRWLIDKFAVDWGTQSEEILVANNLEAPLWLRVNHQRTTVAELAKAFAVAGYDAVPVAHLPSALRLMRSVDVTGLPGYAAGAFSVQDGAAQLAAELLDLRDHLHVLDACAAPGGKTAHILECADVEMVALDIDAQRLPRLRENLTRLGLTAKICLGDVSRPATWWDGRAFDRILLDAPCSATGIIRRQPDIKLHRRAGDITALVAQQARLLDTSWSLLQHGGRLVYATCSILKDENEHQISAFLARHHDARTLAVIPDSWGMVAGLGRQNLPGQADMDGFFYAVIEKSY